MPLIQAIYTMSMVTPFFVVYFFSTFGPSLILIVMAFVYGSLVDSISVYIESDGASLYSDKTRLKVS